MEEHHKYGSIQFPAQSSPMIYPTASTGTIYLVTIYPFVIQSKLKIACYVAPSSTPHSHEYLFHEHVTATTIWYEHTIHITSVIGHLHNTSDRTTWIRAISKRTSLFRWTACFRDIRAKGPRHGIWVRARDAHQELTTTALRRTKYRVPPISISGQMDISVLLYNGTWPWQVSKGIGKYYHKCAQVM